MDYSPPDTWLFYFLSTIAQTLAGATGLVGAFAAYSLHLLGKSIVDAAGIVKKRTNDDGVFLICAQQDYEFLPTKIRDDLVPRRRDYTPSLRQELLEVASGIEKDVRLRERMSQATKRAVLANVAVVLAALAALPFSTRIASWPGWAHAAFYAVLLGLSALALGLLVQVVRVALGTQEPTREQVEMRLDESLGILRVALNNCNPASSAARENRDPFGPYNRARLGRLAADMSSGADVLKEDGKNRLKAFCMDLQNLLDDDRSGDFDKRLADVITTGDSVGIPRT